jgi:hypothetical protein
MSVFTDPIGWSGLAVSTLARLSVMTLGVVLLHALVVYQAYVGNFGGVMSAVALACLFQLLFLYALHRLYSELRSHGYGSSAA